MLSRVLFWPAMPVRWGVRKKGMQDGGSASWLVCLLAKYLWLWSRYPALLVSWLLLQLRLHKQVANMLLLPWMNITTVVSATNWVNWYKLRAHSAARPEICELAKKMLEAHKASRPRTLAYGDWHLPFITEADRQELTGRNDLLAVRSAARCARVSYVNFYGKNDIADDERLYADLVRNGHYSPLEHVAIPIPATLQTNPDLLYTQGNFKGFLQLRKFCKSENPEPMNGSELYSEPWQQF